MTKSKQKTQKQLETMLREKFNFNPDGELDDNKIGYSCINGFEYMNFIDYDLFTNLITHNIVDDSGDVIEENTYLTLQDIENKLYSLFTGILK